MELIKDLSLFFSLEWTNWNYTQFLPILTVFYSIIKINHRRKVMAKLYVLVWKFGRIILMNVFTGKEPSDPLSVSWPPRWEVITSSLENFKLMLLHILRYTAYMKLWGSLWLGRVSTPSCACLPSSYKAKIERYCGPNGPTASIFYGIWITKSGAMVFILNLDKVSLKKLFPTMNG